MYTTLAILAAFAFFYSIVAGRVERWPISGAIVFMSFGLLCGPLGFNILKLDADNETMGHLAELTLALVLFTDAANANLKVLGRSFTIPERLLLIGLPLTILLGFGVAVLILDGLTLFELAILATMLAPTDAALGKAVVTNPAVPDRMREGLNVESGLNDGICVPILFLFLALASGQVAAGESGSAALGLLAEELGIGLLVGLGLTIVGTWALKHCWRRGWITETWLQIPVVGLAFSCFALAQILGGSGFIAAFSGGMLFGSLVTHRKDDLLKAAEGTGDTLALATWVVFGAVVVGHVIGRFTWEILVYVILSLTIVRMLPVFLTLTGMGLKPDAKLFMGWFGPRGLATIVFAVIVMSRKLPGSEMLATIAVCTVIVSILAHGFSANPLVALLSRRMRQEGA